MDHFGTENHMLNEEPLYRAPSLTFDMRRGYPTPMVEHVTSEEIEAMHVQTLRKAAALTEALRITQRQADLMRKNEEWRNQRLTK